MFFGTGGHRAAQLSGGHGGVVDSEPRDILDFQPAVYGRNADGRPPH